MNVLEDAGAFGNAVTHLWGEVERGAEISGQGQAMTSSLPVRVENHGRRQDHAQSRAVGTQMVLEPA
jgi:hypothetical protein